MIGVSWRPVEFNRELCDNEGINYALLSDPSREVIRRYGVHNPENNAARRVTFIIDRQGIIRDIDRNVEPEDYGPALVARIKNVLGE